MAPVVVTLRCPVCGGMASSGPHVPVSRLDEARITAALALERGHQACIAKMPGVDPRAVERAPPPLGA